MAIIKLGVIVVGVRGTLGGGIYSANRSGPYVKEWAGPSNPNTGKQSAQRGLIGTFPSQWRGLTDTQRDDWDTTAQHPSFARTNALGEVYYLSGYQFFVSINSALATVGRTFRDTPPATFKPSAPTIDLFFAGDGGSAAILVDYPASTFTPDYDLVCFGTVIASQGRFRQPARTLLLATNQNPPATRTFLTTPFTNTFGTLTNGFVYTINLHRQTNDGVRSAAAFARAIRTTP